MREEEAAVQLQLCVFFIVAEVRDKLCSFSPQYETRNIFSEYQTILFFTGRLSQHCWGVTYTSTQICAVKGSTVEIKYRYTYPSRTQYQITKVQMKLWFTKGFDHQPVDLKSDSDYTGRVEYRSNQDCTLRITELRESDSAVYKFRFITNHQGGSYTGSPGVTLTVTDAPKLPSVSVSPSAEIVEGSSVTLTCSSDANPAANYTWYKEDGHKRLSEDSQLVFSSIQSSDSGQYYCRAENKLGMKRSGSKLIDVKYAPKLPSVSVSPSAEIVEGSSVTLTCSSDANPAANYTWYKEGDHKRLSEDSQLVFSSIQSSDSGQYYCRAENKLGMKRSGSKLIDLSGGELFHQSLSALLADLKYLPVCSATLCN
uniref:B-cell receptor CD22 n=1 Tax=Oreochromis aureus TaxID=47969 RepID=A0A668RE90_OREAU